MYIDPELFKQIESIKVEKPRVKEIKLPLPEERMPGDPILNPAPEFLPVGGSDPMSLTPTELPRSEEMILANRDAHPGLEELVGKSFAHPIDTLKGLIPRSQEDRSTAPQVIEDVAKNLAYAKLKLAPAVLGTTGLDIAHSMSDKGMSLQEAVKEETGGLALGALAFGPKIGRGLKKGAGVAVEAAEKVIPQPIKDAYAKYERGKQWFWDNVMVVPFKGGDFLNKWHTDARWIPTYQGEGQPIIKKTIAEILQPAVERLPQNLQRTFRNTQAMKANVTKIGELAAKDLEGRGFVSTYEFMKGMRGTPESELASKAARDTLWKVERGVSEVATGPFEEEWRRRIGKIMTASVDSPASVYTGSEAYSFLGRLDSLVKKDAKGLYDMRVAHKVLREAIENPNVSPEMRGLATEVWNFSARFPEQVAEAAKEAAKMHLTTKLIHTPGVVRTELPQGAKAGAFLPSEWSGFNKKGHKLWVERDTELELRALQDIPKISHSVFNKFFMTPWKTGKIILRPATQIRNDFSNVGLNWLGGLPPWRVDMYKKAFDEMRTNGQMWKDFSKITGQGGTFTMNDVLAQTQGRLWGANMFDRALTGFDKIAEKPRSWFNAQEQFFKMAKYVHNLDKGMSKSDAAWDAMKWTFNYGEVTPATAWMRTNVAPFFTWQTKIFPLFAEAAVKNPVAFTGLASMYMLAQQQAIRNVGITDREWERLEPMLPEYIQKGLFLMMPWRDERGRLNLLNMTYMVPGFGDVFDVTSNPGSNFIGSPLITIPMSLRDNKRYSGAPIAYDWEPAGTKFAKRAAYVWEQLTPSLVPGGTDWNMIYRAFEGKKNAPSIGQALASSVGFKTVPLDTRTSAASYEARKRMKRAEITNAMNRELRNAATSKERSDIARKYTTYLRDLEKRP